MNKEKINVVVLSTEESKAEEFIKNVSNDGITKYKDFQIVFTDVLKNSQGKEDIINLARQNDRIILLVSATEHFFTRTVDIIEGIIESRVVPIIVINNVGSEYASPGFIIDDIEHVLFMREASDSQLEAPLVWIDDEKKTAVYDLEDENDNLDVLYDVIIE